MFLSVGGVYICITYNYCILCVCVCVCVYVQVHAYVDVRVYVIHYVHARVKCIFKLLCMGVRAM